MAILVTRRARRGFGRARALIAALFVSVPAAALLSGCLTPGTPNPPVAGVLFVSDARWETTASEVSLDTPQFGVFALRINVTAALLRVTDLAHFDASVVAWPNGTETRRHLSATAASLAPLNATIYGVGDGSALPTSVTLSGPEVSLSAAFTLNPGTPHEAAQLSNATAGRSDRTLQATFPDAGTQVWYVNVTMQNSYGASVRIRAREFSLSDAIGTRVAAQWVFIERDLEADATANFTLEFDAAKTWIPKSLTFDSGAPAAWGRTDPLVTPGNLTARSIDLRVERSWWSAIGNGIVINFELVAVNGPYLPITFGTASVDLANSSLLTGHALLDVTLDRGQTRVLNFSMLVNAMVAPIRLTIDSSFGPLTLQVPASAEPALAARFENTTAFWSTWDGTPRQASPGYRFFNFYYEVTNLADYPLRLQASSFELLNASGDVAQFASLQHNFASLGPKATDWGILTAQVPLSFDPAAVHWVAYRSGWATLAVAHPIDVHNGTTVDLNITAAEFRFYGVNGSHAPAGTYFLWVNLTALSHGNSTINISGDSIQVDGDQRYESWPSEASWAAVGLEPNVSKDFTVAFLVPYNVTMTRVYFAFYGFSPLAQAALVMPPAPTPELSINVSSWELRATNLTNGSAPWNSAYLWIYANVTNAWDISVALGGAGATAFNATGYRSRGGEYMGPAMLAPSASTSAVWVITVPDSWTVGTLWYGSPEGPWAFATL